MRMRVLRGTTAENNSLVLPSGFISVDTEKKSIRIHDGITPGGYEAIGVKVFNPPASGPGPAELLAGDENLGYYGELAAAELIDGETLADQIGLSAGVPHHSDTTWFKFAFQGKTLFVPKVQLRYGLSWEDINNAGAVKGEVEVTIGGQQFKVRLLKGVLDDTSPNISSAQEDPLVTHGSEWNELIYRVCSVTPDSQAGPNWAEYTPEELLVGSSLGATNWCQEITTDGTERVVRGADMSITDMRTHSASTATNSYGWRPVLELVG